MLFWGHVWVTPAAAQRLQLDAMVHGNCFAKIRKDDQGRLLGERIDPLAVLPREREA